MERLLSRQGVYEQRLDEAAVKSFSVDQKNMELRQRLRPTEDQLAVTSSATSPEPLALRPGVRGGFRPVATGTPGGRCEATYRRGRWRSLPCSSWVSVGR